MRIAIPSADDKLCGHFGHCEYFTLVDIEDNKIVKTEKVIPDGGVSCQCSGWVADQGVEVVLAGGMGGRPLAGFEERGVTVILGCPELEIETLVHAFINETLVHGENTCGGGHHECHHHEHGHGCCH